MSATERPVVQSLMRGSVHLGSRASSRAYEPGVGRGNKKQTAIETAKMADAQSPPSGHHPYITHGKIQKISLSAHGRGIAAAVRTTVMGP